MDGAHILTSVCIRGQANVKLPVGCRQEIDRFFCFLLDLEVDLHVELHIVHQESLFYLVKVTQVLKSV